LWKNFYAHFLLIISITFVMDLGLDHNFGHSLIPAKADIQKWLLDSGFRRNDDPFENALPLQYGRRNDQSLDLDLK